MPENRWDRVDIKSVGLLPNVLAKQKAKEAGAQEAWFVDADGNGQGRRLVQRLDRHQDGVLVTRPAEHGILRGITRTTLFDVAAKLGLKIEERGFSRRRSQGGARGLHHLGDDDLHAGRGDRRPADRQRPSGLDRTFIARKPFLTLRKKVRPDNRTGGMTSI